MDKKFMEAALSQAKRAYAAGEVPVGAVIVKDGEIISRARNMREGKQNAICHAEILAIDRACRKLKSFRLDGCEIYVTLEPCPMCAGAICGARLSKVMFGARDKKYGCAGSKHNFFADPDFEHLAQVKGGVMAKESEGLLQEFFAQARRRNRMNKLVGKLAEILPNDLSTKDNTNVDILHAKCKEELMLECEIDGEKFPCVQAGCGQNVVAVVRMKNGTSVLVLGREMSDEDIVAFAKMIFAKGDKIVTKNGKFLV